MSIRSAIASTSRIIPPLASSSRCLTTTPPVLAEQKKKSTVATVKKRQVAGFSGVKKKSGTQRSSGARVKSLKLSYAMASETPDLGDLKVLENGNAVAQHVGVPTTFSKKTFVKLATMGLPRKLEKELDASGQPASIIRQLTVEMADKLADGDQKSSSENKYVLSGESGSGKSVLLLQTVSLAYAADWIVIYAPRAFEWTDGTSPYRYNPSTQMFDQPAIAESILQGFSSVNGTVLSKIRTEEGTDLARICKNALSGGDTVKALETCLDTIAKQTEYPVLFAVDDVQALYAATKYKNPQFETLQSYNFSVPRLALDFLSGRKNLARGMVVSAYSHTTPNVPLSPEFSYALELDSTRPITPYTKMDPAHLAHATAPATKIEVPFGLSTQEAAGMFELWSRRGWTLKSSDEMFMGAFTAAMGNPREFGRGLRFTRQATEHY